jgi:hypothetical protein
MTSTPRASRGLFDQSKHRCAGFYDVLYRTIWIALLLRGRRYFCYAGHREVIHRPHDQDILAQYQKVINRENPPAEEKPYSFA